jgi:hypothetical protein
VEEEEGHRRQEDEGDRHLMEGLEDLEEVRALYLESWVLGEGHEGLEEDRHRRGVLEEGRGDHEEDHPGWTWEEGREDHEEGRLGLI